MSTTKLPNVFITPEPPSSSEVTSALNGKANANDLNNYVTLASTQTISGSKTISSDLNLQPSSSSANTGGKINFHYNQSSSATSSIYESSSGRIKLDCDLWMDNYVYSNINLSGGGQIRFSNIDASTNSSERRVFCFSDKGATALGGLIFLFTSGNADHSARLRVHNNGAYNDLGIAKKSDGDVYTFAPTPATNDNSTKIATTAFVNNRLPYTVGGWTPEIKGSTTAGTFTYSSRNAMYIKLGRLVYIYMWMSIKCTAAPTGNVLITGLPFTTVSCGQVLCANGWGFSGCRLIHAGTYGNITKIDNVGKSVDAVFGGASGTSNDYQNVKCQVNDTAQFFVTGCYMTN